MGKISFLSALFIAVMSNAQIKFENGYIINNSGEKKEVLIKNIDWKYNPTEIEYKYSNSSETKKESINNLKEFGIDSGQKFIREKVLIDRSSNALNLMSEKREPDFKEETLFLKLLVEGKANLYYYESQNTVRFFYNTDTSDEIRQLVYKKYYLNESQITTNTDYKNQLRDLKCNISEKDIQNTNYRNNDLIKIFTRYNECTGGQLVNYTSGEKRDLFNLSVKPGIQFTSLTAENNYIYPPETNFKNKTSFRIGLELEYILPFNKNKWSVFAEPTYQSYKDEQNIILNQGTDFESSFVRNIDYKSVEIPLGIRHYFFLNDKSKLFINGAYVLDIKLGDSKITYEYNELEIKAGSNFIFGAGYKYNNRFSIEARISTARSLLKAYSSWNTRYSTTSLILGYTLF